jgi:hypothetical protein
MISVNVKSGYSLWSVVFATVFGIFGGIILIKVGIEELFLHQNQDVMIILFSLPLGVILLNVALIALFAKYEVTVDRISVKHWWKHRSADWKNIEVVTLYNYWGWGYNVRIKLINNIEQDIILFPSFVGNNHNIVKAIIEAATLSNPSIRFVGIHEFGPPPYGIFVEKKSE